MKRYFVFLGAAVLIFSSMMLTGCFDNEETKNDDNNNVDLSRFVGVWDFDQDGGTYTFDSSKTGEKVTIWAGETYTEFFNWRVDGSNLCLKFGEEERCGKFSFTNESNTFTWTVTIFEETRTGAFNKRI